MNNNEILKEIFLKTGLLQKEFAEKIGSNESQLCHWFSGYRKIRIERLNGILKQFGYNIEYKLVKI